MIRRIRLFLVLEAVIFACAASVHAGWLVAGYEHHEARIAETVIAAVLFAAAMLSLLWPARTRLFGLVAQWFALLGTLVGIFTIVVGVGPRTLPDVVYHIAIVVVLAWGLLVATRARGAL